jgi:hypothetical protein
MQESINSINNLKYMVNSYGLCALEKMVPTDVPVLCLHGQVSGDTIRFLKTIMEKCCIIGVGDTALVLLENDIKVDFIAFWSDTQYEKFESNQLWESVPIIVNTKVPAFIFERHKGKKFFASAGSDNGIENYVFRKSLENSNARYHYNYLLEVPAGSLREYLLSLGIFMSDSYAMLLEEDTKEDDIIQIYQNLTLLRELHASDPGLQQYFKVPVDMQKITSWVIPLFDGKARSSFVENYNNLTTEFHEMQEVVSQSIEHYERLYEMERLGTVEKAELDSLIDCLNKNTAIMEGCEYLGYLMDLAQAIDIPKGERDTPNQIAEAAMDGIYIYRRLIVVLETMCEEITAMNEAEPAEEVLTRGQGSVDNILLVVGISQYDVLPRFVEGLKDGFQKQNVVTYMLVLDLKELATRYNHFYKTVGYHYLVPMNGVYMEELSDDNRYSRIVPMFVDHPVLHSERLKYAHASYAVLFADGNWVKYVQRYRKDVPNPVFLPLGGVKTKGEAVPFGERENKIVFFGSCQSVSHLEDRINTHEYADLIRQIVARLKKNTNMTIEDVVEQMEKENQIDYTIHNIVFHSNIFEIVDSYIRYFFRREVLMTVIRAGLPIDIYGWNDAVLEEFPNAMMKDSVPFDRMQEICKQVKFVLNVQPWTKSGTQERVFNAMLCGAIAVTDEADYLRKQTVDERDLLLYNLDHLEQLPDKLRYYMEHEEEAEGIAASGQELALSKHTWEHRAQELLEYFNKGEAYADH